MKALLSDPGVDQVFSEAFGIKVLQQIQETLAERDESKNDPDMIRLGYKITEKVISLSKSLQTTSLLSRNFGNPAIRDVLIKIGQLSPLFSVFTELDSQ